MCDRKPHLDLVASSLCLTIRSLWMDRQRICTDIHIWMLFAEGCIRPHFVPMEPGAEPVCRFMCRGLQDAVGPGIGGGTECLGGMTVGAFGIGTCPHVQTSGATLGVDEDVPGQICLRGDSRGNPCAIFCCFRSAWEDTGTARPRRPHLDKLAECISPEGLDCYIMPGLARAIHCL